MRAGLGMIGLVSALFMMGPACTDDPTPPDASTTTTLTTTTPAEFDLGFQDAQLETSSLLDYATWPANHPAEFLIRNYTAQRTFSPDNPVWIRFYLSPQSESADLDVAAADTYPVGWNSLGLAASVVLPAGSPRGADAAGFHVYRFAAPSGNYYLHALLDADLSGVMPSSATNDPVLENNRVVTQDTLTVAGSGLSPVYFQTKAAFGCDTFVFVFRVGSQLADAPEVLNALNREVRNFEEYRAYVTATSAYLSSAFASELGDDVTAGVNFDAGVRLYLPPGEVWLRVQKSPLFDAPGREKSPPDGLNYGIRVSLASDRTIMTGTGGPPPSSDGILEPGAVNAVVLPVYTGPGDPGEFQTAFATGDSVHWYRVTIP